MSKTSINVALPKALKEHIERRIAGGEFTNAGDYLRALVRADRSRSDVRDALLRDIAAGLADVEAGRVYDGEAVFNEFLARTYDK